MGHVRFTNDERERREKVKKRVGGIKVIFLSRFATFRVSIRFPRPFEDGGWVS